MATLTKNGRQITVPDLEVAYYLEQGWNSPSSSTSKAYPEGDPSRSWKTAELTAYAIAHGVDLGEARKKDEILAVIVGQSTDPAPLAGFADAARDGVTDAALAAAALAAEAPTEE